MQAVESGLCLRATAGHKSAYETLDAAAASRRSSAARRLPLKPHPLCSAARVQEAKRYCREVVTVLKRLKEQRDMTLNEVRLTVAIEDPRARERRLMGMEVGGCARLAGWTAAPYHRGWQAAALCCSIFNMPVLHLCMPRRLGD